MALTTDESVQFLQKCEEEMLAAMNEKDKAEQCLVDFDLVILFSIPETNWTFYLLLFPQGE